jgi:predicted ATP-binding protein involved in virulence
MRIDRLRIENFKKFERTEPPFELHPHFTLLVGDNGSGKTSVLDALAVAIGLWHKAAPGSGWRNILEDEIRLKPVLAGDRVHFQPQLPSKISVEGRIGLRENLCWTRMIRRGGTRTTNAEAREAEKSIVETVEAAHAQRAPLPVLAYYGAGRAWLPTNKRPSARTSQRRPRQFDAYRNCLDTRIRDRDLNEWFLFEAAAANGLGEGRPGYRAVKQAVLDCIPEADGLRYDSGLKEIVLSIRGFEQPFYNLSAGQRMMLAMVADIAIKAVTLNSYLLGPDHSGATDPMHVLRQSPGIVLIDELDVHLHPIWQRRVATDLKRTFEKIQFVCTSHSPQVIGEVRPEEVRLLRAERADTPAQSYGMDSNWIVEVLMDGAERNPTVKGVLEHIFRLIEQKNLPEAEKEITKLRSETGNSDRLQRAASLVERIKLLGK